MQLSKSELRKQFKARRLALSEAERQSKSQAIIVRLSQVIDWSLVNNLHCFEAIERLGEVNVLDAFISTYKKHIKINNIYVDKKIDDDWQTVVLKGNSAIPDRYDVIIVPMLGFDDRLHRIGYGGGFYDKFLASQPNAKKIGVCFETGKVDKIPNEPHDIPLNLIITEDKTYKS